MLNCAQRELYRKDEEERKYSVEMTVYRQEYEVF